MPTPKTILAKITSLPAQPRVFGLDVMRAVAILAVLLTHAQLVFPVPAKPTALMKIPAVSGTLGVELFFILSGFLIGSILLSLASKFDNLRVLPAFWQRRWFRTLPNYFLFLILNIFAFLFLTREIPNLLLYLTFTQNWLWPHPDFFAQAWSLAVEEWFYLLFPISLFLIYRVSKSFTAAFLLSALVFIVLPTLVRVQWALTPGHNSWDEFFRKVMFVRLDAIMYGVLAAWAKQHFPSAWSRLRIPLLLFGGLVLYFGWSFATSQGLNVSFFAKTFLFSLISIGFACMLPAFDQWTIAKENGLTRLIRLIALWSYSLYLSNLLVIQVFQFVQQKIGKASIPLDIALFVLFYLICLLVSSLVYTYFEKPLTDLREKFLNKNPHAA